MTDGYRVDSGGDSPVAWAAIHDGHDLRPEVAALVRLDSAERLREEDPFTARWTEGASTRLIGTRSRFEIDLNRPPEGAVYRVPDDAWGLDVWTDSISDEVVERSRAIHTAFYADARRLLTRLVERFGRFVVLDLHSYNHRRAGPDAPSADPVGNPEVNVGTGTMDRGRWAPVVDRVLDDLRTSRALGRPLDVRENVKFRGGYFSQWVHDTFPDTGCAIAIEFKKFFMDEWTGVPDDDQLRAIGVLVQGLVPGVLDTLPRVR